MKHSGALHTLITAMILFVAAGSLYSADQQKRTALIAHNVPESNDVAANKPGLAALNELDRDERTLAWLTIVAASILVSALALYRANESVPARSEPMSNRIRDVVANPGGSNAAAKGGQEIPSR